MSTKAKDLVFKGNNCSIKMSGERLTVVLTKVDPGLRKIFTMLLREHAKGKK